MEEIFLAAVDLPEAEQAAFLDAACGPDPGLREEVDSLLRADRLGGASLTTAIECEAGSLLEPILGLRLGSYRVIREIGRGGMGAVYLAERDDDQYHKKVAIKVVKPGMDSADVLGRFRHERQILADLDHPYIARLVDGGTTPEGRPFFVMEYVEGQAIDLYCRERKLDVKARLRLFLRVCEAVSYAHRGLVVHRDLKPWNILVTADGIPKLLDFGVAKLLTPGIESGMTVTVFVGGPLTPEYASPEQVRGLAVTTATDVYSLGAVLYELLTGKRAQTISTRTPLEIERVVCETEVPRPSAVVKRLDPDLDNIVLMAMRKERERRYPSVDELAADITRHLEGLPVRARQDSLAYRTRKYVRRYRLAIGAAGLLVATLVAGVLVAVVEARRTAVEAQIAKREQERSERRLTQMVELADRSLYDVHSAIERLPGATQARRQIVASTLQFLENLAKDARQDERLRYVLSVAYAKVADVQGYPFRPNLGDSSAALGNYQKSMGLIDPLLAKAPDNPQYLLQKVSTENKMCVVLGEMSQWQRALEVFRGALPDAQRLARLRPRDAESRLQEAVLYGSIAKTLLYTDSAAALENADRQVAALARLAKDLPENAGVKLELAGAHGQAAEVLARRDELARASQHQRQAIAIREEAVARDPADVVAKRGLMISYANLAANLGSPWVPNLGDTEGARAIFAKVVAIARELAAADAHDRLAESDLANALARYGAMDPPAPERARSLETLREARAILEKLLAADAKSVGTVRTLALVEEYTGYRLRDMGRTREALAEYRRSLERTERYLAQNPRDTVLVSQALADERAMAELLAAQGDRASAVEMGRRAIARAERVPLAASDSGLAAFYVAKAWATMAVVYRALGECESARAAARKGLAGLRQVAGRVHGVELERKRAEAVVRACGSGS